jgi:hypothetical protein
MTADYSICLGTAGWDVWHSPDVGRSGYGIAPRSRSIAGYRLWPPIRHRRIPIFAGDTGLFVSRGGGARWKRIETRYPADDRRR